MRITVPILVSVLIACIGVVPSGATEPATDTPYEILIKGAIPGGTIPNSVVMLARTNTELQRIWSQVNAGRDAIHAQAVPSVDFEHSMIVVFFATGGHNCDPYKIRRVIEDAKKVTLLIWHVERASGEPGNLCTCASPAFEPYFVIRIPITKKPIGFEIEPERHDCMDDV